jgi:hypothetical protein
MYKDSKEETGDKVQEVNTDGTTIEEEGDLNKVMSVVSALSSQDENKIYNGLTLACDLAEDIKNSKLFREKGAIKLIVNYLSSEFIETIEKAGKKKI